MKAEDLLHGEGQRDTSDMSESGLGPLPMHQGQVTLVILWP